MSGTQTPMLSTTHAVFRGLQEDICNILRGLPDTVPPCLKKGLTDAHLKLSTYHYKIDESPFYLWSSCKSCNYLFHWYLPVINVLVLDPRISYDALKEEFAQDTTLLDQLETAKTSLRSHFNAKYTSNTTNSQISLDSSFLSSTPSSSFLSLSSESPTTPSHNNGSPQKNFTARFQRKRAAIDELSEFWNLPQEDFERCNPVHWWYGRRAQFPKLYCLARDILSIPGMFSDFVVPIIN